jgi:hypothetical protein
VLACLLAAGCSPSGDATHATTRLWLDDDPSSDTFGAVILGPLDGLEGLEPGQRSSLDRQLAAAAAQGSSPLVVWTGTVELDRGVEGCVHPTGQATVLGTMRAQGDDLRFEPRLGFVPGLEYTACADLDALAELLPASVVAAGSRTPSLLRLAFSPAADATPAPGAPRVVAVWPAAETVPENLLRLYVELDQPMTEHDVAGRVHLLDAAGEVIPDAFVDIPHGLWDARSTRLTLFVHPGRIKRGVGPHEVLGPVLEAGSTVTLRVDGELTSRRGVPLGEAFEQTYRVGPADGASPDPDRWRVAAPVDALAPVTLRFDEPLDRYLLQRFVAIYAEGHGEPLAGEPVAGDDGLTWWFTPAGGWANGQYRVEVQRAIEDLAGNTVDRLFDVETAATGRAAPANEVVEARRGGVVELPFAVGG